MAPPDGSACMNRPRAATSTAAFSSDRRRRRGRRTALRPNGPSRNRAAHPMIPATGTTRLPPRTGRAVRIRWYSTVFVAVPHITSRSGRSKCRSSSATTVSNASANTGYAECSPIPMPSSWEPWPGKTKTVLPPGAAVPRIPTRLPTSPLVNSSRPASNRRAHRRPRRHDAQRPTAPPTTTPHRRRQARDAPAHARPAARPATLTQPPTSPTPPTAPPAHADPPPRRRTAGAASTITCALVPLIPNDDTPARRARPSPATAAAGQQRHRARRPVHVRAGLVDMQRRRQHLMAHRQHHLDHAGHPGGRLRVTHVRLDRPQPQRLRPLPRSCP